MHFACFSQNHMGHINMISYYTFLSKGRFLELCKIFQIHARAFVFLSFLFFVFSLSQFTGATFHSVNSVGTNPVSLREQRLFQGVQGGAHRRSHPLPLQKGAFPFRKKSELDKSVLLSVERGLIPGPLERAVAHVNWTSAKMNVYM